MKTILVRYELLPDRVEENVRFVRAVFEALARERPAGVRYATFQAEDRVSFVHLARIDAPDGRNPLVALEAFAAFTAGIRARCAVPPVTTVLDVVGEHDLLAG